MTNVINDTRFLFKILIVENLVRKRIAIIDKLIDKSSDVERRNSLYTTISSQYISLIPVLLIISVAYYRLGFQNADGASLAFDLLVLQQIGKYFGSFQSNRQSTINHIPAYQACLEMMDVFVPQESKKRGEERIEVLGSGIQFEGVSFHYPGGNVGVEKLYGKLPPTGLVFIIGRSGSGKTTLIDILLGLVSPQSGKVLMDGKELTDIDPESLSKILAYLPQDAYLFQGTLRENLTFGDEEVDEEEIFHALDAADCTDVVRGLPEGLETQVLPGGINFSGGERHRFALARAMIRKAKILVLDEPSSSVDARSEQAILQSLKMLSKDLLVIVISHSQKIIQDMENLVVMEKGRWVWQGSYAEFVAEGKFSVMRNEVSD